MKIKETIEKQIDVSYVTFILRSAWIQCQWNSEFHGIPTLKTTPIDCKKKRALLWQVNILANKSIHKTSSICSF